MASSVEATRRNSGDWKGFLSGELAGARAHFVKNALVSSISRNSCSPTAGAVSPPDSTENSSPFLFQGKTLSTKYFSQFLIIQDWSPTEPSQSSELLRWSLGDPGFTLSCTSSACGLTHLSLFPDDLLRFFIFSAVDSQVMKNMSEESLQLLTGGREQHISFNDRREDMEPFRGAESGASVSPRHLT